MALLAECCDWDVYDVEQQSSVPDKSSVPNLRRGCRAGIAALVLLLASMPLAAATDNFGPVGKSGAIPLGKAPVYRESHEVPHHEDHQRLVAEFVLQPPRVTMWEDAIREVETPHLEAEENPTSGEDGPQVTPESEVPKEPMNTAEKKTQHGVSCFTRMAYTGDPPFSCFLESIQEVLDSKRGVHIGHSDEEVVAEAYAKLRSHSIEAVYAIVSSVLSSTVYTAYFLKTSLMNIAAGELTLSLLPSACVFALLYALNRAQKRIKSVTGDDGIAGAFGTVISFIIYAMSTVLLVACMAHAVLNGFVVVEATYRVLHRTYVFEIVNIANSAPVFLPATVASIILLWSTSCLLPEMLIKGDADKDNRMRQALAAMITVPLFFVGILGLGSFLYINLRQRSACRAGYTLFFTAITLQILLAFYDIYKAPIQTGAIGASSMSVTCFLWKAWEMSVGVFAKTPLQLQTVVIPEETGKISKTRRKPAKGRSRYAFLCLQKQTWANYAKEFKKLKDLVDLYEQEEEEPPFDISGDVGDWGDEPFDFEDAYADEKAGLSQHFAKHRAALEALSESGRRGNRMQKRMQKQSHDVSESEDDDDAERQEKMRAKALEYAKKQLEAVTLEDFQVLYKRLCQSYLAFVGTAEEDEERSDEECTTLMERAQENVNAFGKILAHKTKLIRPFLLDVAQRKFQFGCKYYESFPSTPQELFEEFLEQVEKARSATNEASVLFEGMANMRDLLKECRTANAVRHGNQTSIFTHTDIGHTTTDVTHHALKPTFAKDMHGKSPNNVVVEDETLQKQTAPAQKASDKPVVEKKKKRTRPKKADPKANAEKTDNTPEKTKQSQIITRDVPAYQSRGVKCFFMRVLSTKDGVESGTRGVGIVTQHTPSDIFLSFPNHVETDEAFSHSDGVCDFFFEARHERKGEPLFVRKGNGRRAVFKGVLAQNPVDPVCGQSHLDMATIRAPLDQFTDNEKLFFMESIVVIKGGVPPSVASFVTYAPDLETDTCYTSSAVPKNYDRKMGRLHHQDDVYVRSAGKSEDNKEKNALGSCGTVHVTNTGHVFRHIEGHHQAYNVAVRVTHNLPKFPKTKGESYVDPHGNELKLT